MEGSEGASDGQPGPERGTLRGLADAAGGEAPVPADQLGLGQPVLLVGPHHFFGSDDHDVSVSVR